MGLFTSIFGRRKPATPGEAAKQIGARLIDRLEEVEYAVPKMGFPTKHQEIIVTELQYIEMLARIFLTRFLAVSEDTRELVTAAIIDGGASWIGKKGQDYLDGFEICQDEYSNLLELSKGSGEMDEHSYLTFVQSIGVRFNRRCVKPDGGGGVVIGGDPVFGAQMRKLAMDTWTRAFDETLESLKPFASR